MTTDHEDLIRRLEEGYEQAEDDDRIIASHMIISWYQDIAVSAAAVIRALVEERNSAQDACVSLHDRLEQAVERAEKSEAEALVADGYDVDIRDEQNARGQPITKMVATKLDKNEGE